MPKIKNAMRAAAHEAGAKNYIRLALSQRLQYLRVFRWIVLEIGVLNNDEIAGCLLDAATQSRALTHVPRLQEDAQLRMLFFQLGQDLGRAIGRSIVYTE